MDRPLLPEQAPSEAAINSALRELCAKPRGWWIIDNGVLMGLARTQERMPKKSDHADDFSDAVRAYLEEAVKEIVTNQNKVILQVVLGLGEKRWRSKGWRNRTVHERREEAGRLFRGDDGKVKGGTIRQLYEGPAIAELAAIVWRDEQEARGVTSG